MSPYACPCFRFSSMYHPPSPFPPPLVTAHGRYYSKGYDLEWAKSDPASHRSLVRDFLSLQMPKIAAINGHAAGAGMILPLSHDYVVTNSRRGFLYMSEMYIGLVVPRWFVAIVKGKLGGRGRAVREVLMKAAEAVGMGLVKEGCDGPERKVERSGLGRFR